MNAWQFTDVPFGSDSVRSGALERNTQIRCHLRCVRNHLSRFHLAFRFTCWASSAPSQRRAKTPKTFSERGLRASATKGWKGNAKPPPTFSSA
jgi:hypothetical protein